MADDLQRRGTPRISLVLVSHSYPPVLGGSEIEAQRVCAALIRRGHKVTVLCAGGPPMPDVTRWIDPEGVPVRIFGRRRSGRWRDYTFALAVAWTLFRERRNYDLIYFLMQGIHLATGLPVGRGLGKAMVMKVSGSSLITLMCQSWVGRLELRWLKSWVHRIMILNEGMAAEAAAAGLDSKRLLWMPNPVDTTDFAPCARVDRDKWRLELGIPEASRCVVFVGRLAPEKELSSLLRAMSSVARRVPHVLLLLVGDGPSRAELEKLAGTLELNSNVRFVGRQTVVQVRKWLQASDVFTLISSNEGFPCSLVEAMSVALPSVVSDIPANTQLVDHGVHGLHAVLMNAGSIAEALIALLEDDETARHMGRMARERVIENYSIEKVIGRYEKLFAEALAGDAD